MQITPLYLVIAAFIGLLLGLLIANIFSGRDSRPAKKNLPPKEMQDEGYIDVANLWYSPTANKIVTEMDGEYYRDTRMLTTDQKTKVLKLLSMWQEWTERDKVTQPAAVSQETLPVTPEAKPAEENVVVQPFKESTEDVDIVSDLREEEEYLGEEEIPEAEEKKPSLSITEQISLILEDMLQGTPLQEKGIRLIENQQHGVDVWVGLEKYPGIDAVPDPAVKDMIRNAVLRWEEENEAHSSE